MAETNYILRGGNVVKYGNGWRARVTYHAPTGERKEKTRVFKVRGKKEAKVMADAWVAELNQKATLAPSPAKTVGEYVDAYINGLEGRVEPSTVAHCRMRAKYIHEAFDNVPLEDLTADMVNNWMNKLAKRLSPVSVNDARKTLKLAMDDAFANKRILTNPMDTVKKLKQPRTEPNALTAQGREALLADLKKSEATLRQEAPSILGVRIALFTGMRRGEICGLRWRDIDFENNLIQVRQSIGEAGNDTYIKEPKTKGSRRDIPLPSYLREELTNAKADMQKRSLAAGVSWRESFFVIGDIDGSYMKPHSLTRAWRRRANRLKLIGSQGTPPTFHDLRHTFATTAIANGADVKSVSSILGHSSTQITLDIYCSDDPQAKRNAMENVEAALLAPAPKASMIYLQPTGTEGK